jgi:hypothetical protein
LVAESGSPPKKLMFAFDTFKEKLVSIDGNRSKREVAENIIAVVRIFLKKIVRKTLKASMPSSKTSS